MDETLKSYRRQIEISRNNFWYWAEMYEQSSPFRIIKRRQLLHRMYMAMFDYVINLEGITSYIAETAGLDYE